MTPPRKEDPWEARERQREQWRRGSSRSSGRKSRPSPRGSGSAGNGGASDSIWEEAAGSARGLREDYVVWGVLAVVGVLLFSEVPNFSGLAREQMARVATLLLLLLFGAVRGLLDDFRVAWRRGPNPLILLLAGWAIFETVRVPAPLRGFAITELLRVLDGIGVYFLCAYCLKAPRQTGFVATGLLAMGVCLSLFDISRAGQHGLAEHINTKAASYLGTHEAAGSLLVLLLPIAAIFAVSTGIEEKRRYAAIAATMVLGVALLIARTRSAWIGGFVALIVLALLAIRFPNDDPEGASSRRSSRSGSRSFADLLGSPVALLAAAMFVFLLVAGAAPFVVNRATSIKSALKDASFTGRVEMWSGAARMTAERPLIGWGLGAYPIIEADWTHSGIDKSEALQNGVSDDNLAHDYYLQWATDTGGIGLALYVGIFALFFVSTVRALPRVTSPPQRALLCGCLATVAGATIDSLASPAYNFHGVYTVLWCALGLGVAAMRPLVPARKAATPTLGPALDPIPLPLYLLAALIAAAAPVAMVFAGKAIVHHGTRIPRGRLELLVTPPNPAPGETIRWTVLFHDGANRIQPTAAGTLWRLSVNDAGVNKSAILRAKRTLLDSATQPGEQRNGIFAYVTPTLTADADGTPPHLTMHAIYQDTYGRWYDAYSIVDVRVLRERR